MKNYGATLRIYDNGGETLDRYTVIPPRWAAEYRERDGMFTAIGCSQNPSQGFGQHTSAQPGKHLGKRIAWDELPEGVQRFARYAFPEYAPFDILELRVRRNGDDKRMSWFFDVDKEMRKAFKIATALKLEYVALNASSVPAGDYMTCSAEFARWARRINV